MHDKVDPLYIIFCRFDFLVNYDWSNSFHTPFHTIMAGLNNSTDNIEWLCEKLMILGVECQLKLQLVPGGKQSMQKNNGNCPVNHSKLKNGFFFVHPIKYYFSSIIMLNCKKKNSDDCWSVLWMISSFVLLLSDVLCQTELVNCDRWWKAAKRIANHRNHNQAFCPHQNTHEKTPKSVIQDEKKPWKKLLESLRMGWVFFRTKKVSRQIICPNDFFLYKTNERICSFLLQKRAGNS